MIAFAVLHQSILDRRFEFSVGLHTDGSASGQQVLGGILVVEGGVSVDDPHGGA
jgi:hypothetical protein